MGWGNPRVPWSQLEAGLRGTALPGADGNDAPAWSRRRERYQAPPLRRIAPSVDYAELHVHSNFSFLDGASSPEALVEEAARLGIETIALTDHDGMYGVVRFAEAARELGISTVFGAELSLGLERSQVGRADPDGTHLLVLACDPAGYARLCEAITDAQLAGEKGAPRYATLEALADQAQGHWMVLTGCRKGGVTQSLVNDGPAAARRALQRLISAFGREHVAVELTDHGDPLDMHRNDALVALAMQERVEVVVTNNVHYARPVDYRLASTVAAIRARRSLDEMNGWLPVTTGAHLRSGLEQSRRFRRYPGVIEATAALGRALRFDWRLVAPDLPDFPVPAGQTPTSHLRALVEAAGDARYGPRDSETVPGAWRQIDHELAVIDTLGFPGYFLIVHDIVGFCQANNILCQGRGSAANSAVCYVLGITKADAVSLGLLFERFLTPERDGPPDIDLDIESGRREEVIQYVYERYGRRHAAQVANVITYRSRSAVRDAGRALGYSRGQLDVWTKQVTAWSRSWADSDEDAPARPEGVPDDVLTLAAGLIDAPRHLGIHSGGMVLCDRPISQVVPIEHARMDARTVLQWDKDDCAAAGLVKFDLLGLGMLSALHDTIDLVAAHHGVTIDLATLPQEDAVYDMLCRADAIGVFQVESRAQLATLPRLKPRTFYDLVVEVAIIRPGPIQGGSVHPYIRRRNGEEPVVYLHPLLEKSLARTLGVPLFQEQLMQMAVDVAGLTAGEADQLRQAMGAKRSNERMERLRQRLYDGMAERGVAGETADRIYAQIAAFADFGFPESHSVSFAYLVYASAWCKLHYPAAFLTGLLNNQPMGFYSPQSLVADARRHGVVVHRPDINRSAASAGLEADSSSAGDMAVRLGLSQVRGVGEEIAERIAAEAPYRSMDEVVRRTNASVKVMESLAAAGACASLSTVQSEAAEARGRRRDLWGAGVAAWQTADRLEGTGPQVHAPSLPGLTPLEVTAADMSSMAVSPTSFPLEHLRGRLRDCGVLSAEEVSGVPHGRRVDVGGIVSHRQQPATAGGTVFINLEDETGMTNVICSPAVWKAHLKVAVSAPALIVTGRVERSGEAVSLVAQRLRPLQIKVETTSRDFR
ncbi:MAG: error-prone DNA polymerase [Nitriliruptoraceae bacterium]